MNSSILKKIMNSWRNHPEYNCFGCCPVNPIGLHLEFYEDGDYIVPLSLARTDDKTFYFHCALEGDKLDCITATKTLN